MSRNDAAIYNDVLTYITTTRGLPLKVVRKRSSAFMWLIYVVSFMWIWNRRFMSDYTTTIAGRMYVPDGVSVGDAWRTLAHEGVHAMQAKRVGELWFSIAYLFPLPMALLTLGTLGVFVTPWAWFCLLALAGLAPLPAPWRVLWEREAYMMTAICDSLLGFDIRSDWYLKYQVDHHCGWGYYRPAWDRARVERKVRADLERAVRIVQGAENDSYYADVIAIVRRYQETFNA